MNEEAKTTILGVEVPTSDPEVVQEEVTVDSYIEQFVGEGKKYQDAEALAKAYAHAEGHIETVLGEKKELEVRYQALEAERKTIDDILAELDTRETPTPTPVEATPPTPVAEPVDVAVTVKNVLAEERAKDKAAELEAKAWETIDAAFEGRDNALKAMAEYIGNDESRKQLLGQMAIVDTEGMIARLKAASKPVETFTDQTVSEGSQPIPQEQFTWSYCRKIRQDDPKLYNSMEFQRRMHEAQARNPNFINT
jgi:hypothetical protein